MRKIIVLALLATAVIPARADLLPIKQPDPVAECFIYETAYYRQEMLRTNIDLQSNSPMAANLSKAIADAIVRKCEPVK